MPAIRLKAFGCDIIRHSFHDTPTLAPVLHTDTAVSTFPTVVSPFPQEARVAVGDAISTTDRVILHGAGGVPAVLHVLQEAFVWVNAETAAAI